MMNIRIKYTLTTVFWILALIWGWQIAQVKNHHWIMFGGWIIIMTIVYIWMMKEWKNRRK